MVKNERSPSPTPPASPSKKPRTTKSPAKAKGPNTPKAEKMPKEPPKTPTADTSGGKPTPWDADACVALLEAVIDAGTKSTDLQALADKLGVTRSQVVDQLKPNRSNVRRFALDLVRAKKGGA